MNHDDHIKTVHHHDHILCATDKIYPSVPVMNSDIKLAIGNNNIKVLHRIRVCYYIDADYNCNCETIEEIGCGKTYQEALINAIDKTKITQKKVIEEKSYKGPFNHFKDKFSCNKDICNICVETVTVTAIWESCKYDFYVISHATATSSGITCKVAKDKAWRRAYDEAYHDAYLKGLSMEKEKEKENQNCNNYKPTYIINDYDYNSCNCKSYCVDKHKSYCYTNTKCNCHNKCNEKKNRCECKDDVIPLYKAHDSNLILEQEQNIRHRDRDMDMDRHRDGHRDGHRDRDMDMDMDRHRDRHRDGHRDRDMDMDRHRDRHRDGHRDSYRNKT